VVVVVIVATAFRLLQGGGSAGRATTNATTPSRTPAESTSPSASPAPSATIPAAFAGTWSGVVRQPPTDTYPVSVSLKAGSAQGAVSYSGIASVCIGILSLRGATATKLTMSQTITTGACETGNVTISVIGAGTVWSSFRSAGPIASGKLTRS
jgi:hypothetical protein